MFYKKTLYQDKHTAGMMFVDYHIRILWYSVNGKAWGSPGKAFDECEKDFKWGTLL